jgi:hypothetical protein
MGSSPHAGTERNPTRQRKNGARRKEVGKVLNFPAAASGFARPAIDAGGFFVKLSGHL